LNRLSDHLDLGCTTVSGKTLGDDISGAQVWHDETIRPLDRPVSPEGGVVVLRGNIAPDGAVMKASAADPRLLRHRGPVLAFESYDEMAAAVDRDDLDVTPDHVLVLKNAGPQGGPGMPEWGMLPIPLVLVKAGVRDMLRISDARMSGTSYGACILHVAPEAFVGGPFACVQTGDVIEVDVAARRLHLDVSDDELARRRAAWKPRAPHAARGYGAIFAQHVGQADAGCDFEVLGPGPELLEPEIH
jgi:dihydroxy-acid dehydratase